MLEAIATGLRESGLIIDYNSSVNYSIFMHKEGGVRGVACQMWLTPRLTHVHIALFPGGQIHRTIAMEDPELIDKLLEDIRRHND